MMKYGMKEDESTMKYWEIKKGDGKGDDMIEIEEGRMNNDMTTGGMRDWRGTYDDYDEAET